MLHRRSSAVIMRAQPSCASTKCRVVALAITTLLVSTEVSAQTCRGFAPLTSASPIQIGGGFGVGWGPTDARLKDLSVSLGNEHLLANAQLTATDFRQFGYNALGFNLSGGPSLRIPVYSRVIEVCPSVSHDRSSATQPGDYPIVTVTSGWAFGSDFGTTVSRSSRVRVVPFVGLSVVSDRTVSDYGCGFGSISTSQFGEVHAGVGVAVSRVSVTATFATTLGVRDAGSVFRVDSSISVPRLW